MSCPEKENELVQCVPYRLKLRRVVCAQRYRIAKAREAGLSSWGDATGSSLTADQLRDCMSCADGLRRTEQLGMTGELQKPKVLRGSKARRGVRHPRSKYSEKTVREILTRHRNGERPADIARSMQMNKHAVASITQRKIWKHLEIE